MPDQILKEVTHLGSTLAELATKQLSTVIDELAGPAGGGHDAKDAERPRRVNAGTMAFNVLQLMSKAGELLTELSKYDLVRRGTPALTLRSSNPLTTLPLQAGESHSYEMLVENEGNDEFKIVIKAELFKPDTDQPLGDLKVHGGFEALFASERRRVSVTIPELEPGTYILSFTIEQRESRTNILGKKSITLNVLPPPQSRET